MVLSVPAVSFSVGSSAPPASGSDSKVDMSLDEMIKQRRKEQQSKSRKGAAGRAPSTADRVTGTNKAKRAAAVKARRGMKAGGSINNTTKPKASAMDVEREVYRQSRKTAKSKESSLRKKTGGRLPPAKDSATTRRRQSQRVQDNRKKMDKQRQMNDQSKQVGNAIYTWTQGTRRPPSKKAVNAAVDAMQSAGFKVPSGMQMVISFAPAPDGKNPPPQPKGKNGGNNNRNNNNNNNGGRNPPRNNNRNNTNKGGGRRN
eukprot:CAMPEP_0195280992 /NCGR_PEP_ID=MMETSP0707-20130614/478_1 /TAXON_ID=33640 /ORGANISM="Asterionellopsis glacialis, Strain CCMP134" /LENGTH=257 /DNA_ID=CAMNT_0040339827 /DNA_START=78 /DNA_END=851 /DNA_ORIENTATION=-